jgi:hypothetical protein
MQPAASKDVEARRPRHGRWSDGTTSSKQVTKISVKFFLAFFTILYVSAPSDIYVTTDGPHPASDNPISVRS